jgi:hypothetical protein
MQQTVAVTFDDSSLFSSTGSTFYGAESDNDGRCILNYVCEPGEVDTGHNVQLVRSARKSSKYCSSCRKQLKTSAFSLRKKTCSDCLSKKSKKRNHLRGALTSPNNTANVYRENTEEWRRKCSTCKCMKAITDFMGDGKTCIKCKRRKNVRARSVNYDQPDLRDDDYKLAKMSWSRAELY